MRQNIDGYSVVQVGAADQGIVRALQQAGLEVIVTKGER
jgi:hypothetical protein